jgi:two-component system, NtrC family, sensor kinase
VFAKRSIRTKILITTSVLCALVMILVGAGLYATYAYRSLVKTLSDRVIELPVAAELSRRVGDLRIILGELQGIRANPVPPPRASGVPLQVRLMRDRFRDGLSNVETTLKRYDDLLDHKFLTEPQVADNQHECDTVRKIRAALEEVYETDRDADWMLDSVDIEVLDARLENLQDLSMELPNHLHTCLAGLANTVRTRYRTLIAGTSIAGAVALVLLLLFFGLELRWIFRPLQALVHGSRRVARGDFDFRIRLETDDEISELAHAMNAMTHRFQTIRDNLDRRVREQTKQIVRSEQLASVGLLAAGVAHEINNPLASIAMCAESLEGRVEDLAAAAREETNESEESEEADVARRYLGMIQREAFRCKEITEKLLDFSRTGSVRREPTELSELIRGVIEMVEHLGKYRGKRIEFESAAPVTANVNAQEIKQVVLNLLTNALDSLDDTGDGVVCLRLDEMAGTARLSVADNGCGMSEEVIEHIFEPFFTRRASGGGTGLGLSITYRIVDEHGGSISVESEGPRKGSVFKVRFPLNEPGARAA